MLRKNCFSICYFSRYRLYFYSLEKKCSKDLQMQKDEIFVKLHIYGLPIRKDQWDDRWIFDEVRSEKFQNQLHLKR